MKLVAVAVVVSLCCLMELSLLLFQLALAVAVAAIAAVVFAGLFLVVLLTAHFTGIAAVAVAHGCYYCYYRLLFTFLALLLLC